MARIIPWPAGMGIKALQSLAGPNSIGAGSSTSVGGFMQTLASPYGGWAYQFSIPVCQGEGARRLRGWLAAMHMGANATLVPWRDADMMTPVEAGLSLSETEEQQGLPWDTGMGWSNLLNWQGDYPKQPVLAASAYRATTVLLGGEFWGKRLGYGDLIGFDNHFGKYMVTEDLGAGRYRVWPPLRAAVTTQTQATLYPVLAMRPDPQDPGSYSRNESHVEETTITLYEVEHQYLDAYFAD